MNRRQLMHTTAATSMALLFLGKRANAQEAPSERPEKFIFEAIIGTNHGHGLILTSEEIILLLRQSLPTGEVSISIQGASSHPHLLSLLTQQCIDLLMGVAVITTSSVDFGHSHEVRLTLAEL